MIIKRKTAQKIRNAGMESDYAGLRHEGGQKAGNKRTKGGKNLSYSGGEASANPSGHEPPPRDFDDLFFEDSELFQAGDLSESDRNDRRLHFRRVEDKSLISKAHEEANAIRENAQQEGFQEGLNQAGSVLEELRSAMTGLFEAREKALLSAANEISAMAVMAAERIIRTEVRCDPELVLSLVQETIQRAGRYQKSLLVKVNPADLETVRSAAETPGFKPDSDMELLVMADEGVDAGSCLLETKTGMIDATFATQLELMKRLLGLGGS